MSLVESLVAKHLAVIGTASGRAIADAVCLPFGVLEPLYQSLCRAADHGAYRLGPVERLLLRIDRTGARARRDIPRACAIPVRLPCRCRSTSPRSKRRRFAVEAPKRTRLEKAFADISIDPNLFDSLGPAVNSGAGMFLYGAPGNGKSTLARRITVCFGQQIWLPQTLIVDGQIVKLFDAVYHDVVEIGKRAS